VSKLAISPLGVQDIVLFDQHMQRHVAESGRGDYHFMPFEPDGSEGPKSLDASKLALKLTDKSWQRWWVARSADGQKIVGHIDLKGGELKTQLHRCELGVGIEREWRSQGLGKNLMQVAIRFCRLAPSIDWLDLNVFAHNKNARALYANLGFVELGTYVDRFRIGAGSIDDVIMVLDVRA